MKKTKLGSHHKELWLKEHDRIEDCGSVIRKIKDEEERKKEKQEMRAYLIFLLKDYLIEILLAIFFWF